ncbi:MAG: hypothetical protein N2169_00385 [bacterium]|nr:hypothetical protein [bacterium]
MFRIIFYFFISFLVVFGSVLAEDQPQRYIYHTSDKLFYDAKNKVFELSGNVQIFYSDSKISCDVFKYYEDKKYGKAEGNPRMYNPQVFLKSSFIDIFFEKKQAVALQRVYLRVKNNKKHKNSQKDKNSKNQWEYFELYTDKLVYNWERENIFIPDKLKITSKDLYLTADQLIYSDKTKVMILKGNVEGKNKDQIIKADKITYNIDKDLMIIEGNVRSVIRVSEKKENEDSGNRNDIIAMQTKEIYEAVINENRRTVDYFVSNNSSIPNIEIYLNYYTTIEIYKDKVDYHLKFSFDQIRRSEIVFTPLGYNKQLYNNEEIYNVMLRKLIAWYINKEDKFFFENYRDSINFVVRNLYSSNVILFSSPKDMNIILFDSEDRTQWIKDLIYSTSNLTFVKGYHFDFSDDLYFFDFFRNNHNNKEIFFVIDGSFWKNIDYNKKIVFNNYPFKVNLLLDMNYFNELDYSMDEFLKFIFWKSYLYNCSIFVNRDLYNIRLPYFRLVGI